jgi:hypothetical protein
LAIYGTRAANGVIIILPKGKGQKVSVEIEDFADLEKHLKVGWK